MIIQPDRVVARYAAETLEALRADPAALQEVFVSLEADERDEIEAFFGGQEIPVRLGYPRGPADLPGVYVTLGGVAEDAQAVGSTFGDTDAASHWLEERGTWFRGPIHLACWTLNANLSAWLADVVRWGLLKSREEMDREGLVEQRLTMTDLEPLPQWFPDFAFRRDIVLTALCSATFVTPIPKVEGVTVSGRAVGPPGEPVTVSVRRRT